MPSAAWESRTAVVTSPSRTAATASVMASTLSSSEASGSTANMALNACGTDLVSTTAACTSSHAETAASAAMRMLPLSGRTMTLSALHCSMASRRSAVEGFMVWPPETTTSTPSERRMSASPEPGATATKPSGFLGSGAAASLSARTFSVRSCASRSMLWTKTL